MTSVYQLTKITQITRIIHVRNNYKYQIKKLINNNRIGIQESNKYDKVFNGITPSKADSAFICIIIHHKDNADNKDRTHFKQLQLVKK